MKLEDERKNNPVPISTGNKLFFKNSRYSLEFDPNEGSYKLIINDVAKSDEGKYQCQVVTTPENVITAGPSMSFYPDFILILSRFLKN